MKLTDEQKELNRQQIGRINNWKEISGKNGFWWIAIISLLVIVIFFIVFWLIDVVIVACNKGGLGGLKDFWSYFFAAFKISPPGALEGPMGWNIVSFWIYGIVATLLTPFLTAAITNSIAKYIDDTKFGRKVYKNLYGHYVLIGYNHYATQILSQLLSINDESYAIILTTQNPIKIRESVENELAKGYAKRVIIYAGDALQKEKIDDLRLLYAEKLYLLDESEPHGSQYSRNLSVLKNITDAVAERTEPLEVYMQINNFKAYNLMQRVDIPQDFFANKKGDIVVDFRPFNFYENWARLLWSFHKLPQYDTLDFEPLEGTDKQVHLVISCFNSMGRALLLEALRLCHYPNFDEATGKNKTIITIFDSRWEEMKDAFNAQYPLSHLQQITDIELDFQGIDVNSDVARNQMEQWACDEKQLLTIALCEKDPDTAMTKALNLPEEIFRSRAHVLVRQELEHVNEDVFESDNKRVYPHLYFFGMLQEGVDMKQLDDQLAMCINGIYDFYKGTPLDLSDTQRLFECRQQIRVALMHQDDESWNKEWLKKSQTDKWSSRFQSDMFKTYLSIWERHNGLSSKEFHEWQEILADMEHRRWIAERTIYGFRQKKGGETKDKRMKIHVDIKPYIELENETKNYDRNVVNTAPILVEELEKNSETK